MSGHRALDLRDVMRTVVDHRTKGFPAVREPVALGEVAAQRWSLTDLEPPVLVLRERALEHNLALMADFCRSHGVDLAPHGKTTMAPQLWACQLEAGAWGISAATVRQARVMRDVGVRRVLLANELVDASAIDWVADRLDDPSFELVCYVDSARSVEILADELRRLGAPRRLRVLVELGHAGGRTGCRAIAEAVEVARLVGTTPQLQLVGVAGYEGTICRDRSPECLAAVIGFLDDLRSLTQTLIDGSAFAADEVLLSAGGSAFFDLVVARLGGGWPATANVRVLLRSGCYLTHDSGYYERISPLSGGPDPERRFRPALEVWGSVLSRPEPALAILGLGKRDVSFDLDLPVPFSLRTSTGGEIDVAGRLEITALNDQHAFCRIDPGVRVEVGDLVGSGISHPCAAFDRWRVIPVLDEGSTVIDAVATFF
jgi:D-serine deaminase-like pyridoxal phosphate-dependent protein